MTEDEIIILDNVNDDTYHAIANEAVRYAIVSLPFTTNRMAIPDEQKRAINIAKGKIAEALFRMFCKNNNIPANFDACTTPFWTIDKRDFILGGYEWDIKNNFLYTEKDLFSGNYTDLPALIPNRYDGDQWSKRNEKVFEYCAGVRFLFTFLKAAHLKNTERGQAFLEIILNDDQLGFLKRLYRKYKGLPQQQSPFSESWFWREMSQYGNSNLYKLHFKPALIITGFACRDHCDNFKNTGPDDDKNHFQDHLKPLWYSKTSRGSCNFLNHHLMDNNHQCYASCITSRLIYKHVPTFTKQNNRR